MIREIRDSTGASVKLDDSARGVPERAIIIYSTDRSGLGIHQCHRGTLEAAYSLPCSGRSHPDTAFPDLAAFQARRANLWGSRCPREGRDAHL